MLLAAHHASHPDEKNPGLLTRNKRATSTNREFLKYSNWLNQSYKEIEHVAPKSEKNPAAYPDVFTSENLKNHLGNFCLLPKMQNSSLKDSDWEVKRLCLKMMSEHDLKKREVYKDDALKKGIPPLPPKIDNQILNKSFKEVEMIKGLEKVIKWDSTFIKNRSKNLSMLVFDLMNEWLTSD